MIQLMISLKYALILRNYIKFFCLFCFLPIPYSIDQPWASSLAYKKKACIKTKLSMDVIWKQLFVPFFKYIAAHPE